MKRESIKTITSPMPPIYLLFFSFAYCSVSQFSLFLLCACVNSASINVKKLFSLVLVNSRLFESE